MTSLSPPVAAAAPPSPTGDTRARRRSLVTRVLASARAPLRRAGELLPWRPLGVLLTASAYAGLEHLAYGRLDLVWLVVGYLALALTTLCPLIVLIAASVVRLRGPSAPTREGLVLETGIAAPTGFALGSLWWLPLVSVRWHWGAPAGAQLDNRPRRGRLVEWAEPSDRGRHEAIERRVLVEDPLGLCRLVVRLREPVRLDVLPRLAGLRQLPALTAFASGDALPHPLGVDGGDRVELQRYVRGDPARWIHWKVLARTRELMVRLPERALTPAHRTAAFFVAGADDDASAALARLALQRGLLGPEWAFGSDARVDLATRTDEAIASLVESSAQRARGGAGLSAFVEQVEREGPASVLLFVPARPGPWLERVAALVERRRPRVLIGVDAVRAPEHIAWWRRLLWTSAPAEGTPAEALAGVIERLGRAGAEVVVVDRDSGRVLSDTHRRALWAPHATGRAA